ncbi:MAG: tetratricopeptide repeat protein [Bacteroidetes bacterium]|nr:tetratricopeptide repeat protein [Bacteroidota bacterium]
MRKYKQLFLIIVSAFILVPFTGISQTKNDAISAYNEGAQLIKSNPVGAIEAFNKCIKICDAVGDEAEETRVLAETQLPGLHYKLAMESYKQKKIEEAIEKFKKAGEIADKYNNSSILAKVNKVVPQLYMVRGNSLMKQNPQEALKNLDKAVELNPNLTKAYLAKGLIYKDLGDELNMKASLIKTMEVGFAHNDIKTADQAELVLRTFYFNKAVTSLKTENMAEAETCFKSAVEYGSKNPMVYFQLGKIYNSNKQYELAVQTLKRAEEFENGGDAEKAGIFYEMGNAYIGLENNSEACIAFKKAMFGDYAEGAKYQIEVVLKCK